MLENLLFYLFAPKKPKNVKLKNLLGFSLKERPLLDLLCVLNHFLVRY